LYIAFAFFAWFSEELLVHWEQVAGAEGGTVSINQAPSMMPQQVLHPPTPVSMPVEVGGQWSWISHTVCFINMDVWQRLLLFV